MVALRSLAARLRSPAAAAVRGLSQAPRASPPAGTSPRFFFTSFQGRQTYATKDATTMLLYRDKLKLLDGLKGQEREMRKKAGWDPQRGKQMSEMVLLARVSSAIDGYCAESDPLIRE